MLFALRRSVKMTILAYVEVFFFAMIGLSLILQGGALILALRLGVGALERWRIPFMLVSLAFALMVIRRVIGLFGAFPLENLSPDRFLMEAVALVISAIFFSSLVLVKQKIGWVERDLAEVERQRLRLELLSDSVRGCAGYLDGKRRLVSCNRVFTEWMEIGREALQERPLEDHLPQNLKKLFLRRWEECQAKGKIQGEVRLRLPGGGRIVDMTMVAANRVVQGEHDGGAFLIMFDISAIKRVESRLREALQRETALSESLHLARDKWKEAAERARVMAHKAEEANHAKSEYLAMVSHDIRNPLNTILGFAELIHGELMDRKEEGKLMGWVESIRAGSRDLMDLLNSVLEIAKVESGRLEIHRRPVDPEKLLRNWENQFGVLTREKGLSWKCSWEGEPPGALLLDRPRLNQVLGNLVGNAVKFTAEGGVELKAGLETGGAGTLLRIEVCDTGIGIPEEQLSRIFEPFQQGGAGIHEKFGGAGLGLTVARFLVNAMGGTLSVDSTLAKGSCFTVKIPVGSKVPEKAGPMRPKLSGVLTRGTGPISVLIVDDSSNNRLLLESMLDHFHCRTATAKDGREALQVLEGGSHDLVLLDLAMPVMNGFETIKEIRNRNFVNQSGNPVSVIGVSANVMEENRKKALASGMDGFLGKPFSLMELREAMEESLHDGKKAIFADW